MEVYAVTYQSDVENADYPSGIIGIFSTREKAQFVAENEPDEDGMISYLVEGFILDRVG